MRYKIEHVRASTGANLVKNITTAIFDSSDFHAERTIKAPGRGKLKLNVTKV